ncbi:MAG: class I SAM-dependent methyltransferase [Gemmatimonadetes bacterium]|nr:class I SAM-dependent methyltransferase [Gemmatimonadota bacterium]
MSWLDRLGSSVPKTKAEEAEVDDGKERSAPGLASLFAALRADGRHTVLDFGPAEGRRLRLLGRFARQVRFAALVPHPPRGTELTAALGGLEPDPGRRFDVVLVWDLFDRLDDGERNEVVERIVDVTAAGARLYAVVESSDAVSTRPIRTELLELDRVRDEPVGPPEPARPQLLPAQMERLLAPFEVVSGVSLRSGLREYVAWRPV